MRTVVRSHLFLIREVTARFLRRGGKKSERKMKVKTIKEIREFLAPFAEEAGVRLFDVEFKHGKNPSLTVYIDKDGGVDLDSCERFHNLIDAPLDELDPTFGLPYTLNVSSPGADRPFKTDEDFLSHIGKKVEIKLYNSIKGKKSFDAELVSYDGQRIVFKTANDTVSVELKNVVKVNEYIEF